MKNVVQLADRFDKPASETEKYGSDMLTRLRPHFAEIAAAADAGERNRCIVPEVVEKLRDAGIYRMLIPQAKGGAGLTMAQGCHLIEEISMADGAAGWSAMVAYGAQVAVSRMTEDQADAVLANGPDVMVRGVFAPTGKAIEVEGGYIVSGRWPFASGPFDPDWLLGGCILFRDGAPVMDANGQPEMLVALIAGNEKVRFFDNWDVVGMSGTNSCDYGVEDLFVPASHVSPLSNWFAVDTDPTLDAPMFRIPFVLTNAPTHSSVVIGLARAALEELVTLSKTKRRTHSMVCLADDPVFHDKIGEISSRLAALRALQQMIVTETSELIDSGAPLPDDILPRIRSWVSHIHTECVRLINDCFTLAGTTPVYRTSRIQRQWRDARTAAQHQSASPVAFQELGKLLVQA